MFGEPWVVLAIVALAVLVGAATQSAVGLGLGLVSAPTLTFAAPDLMPGGLLMLTVVLPLITLVRDHDEIDWRGLAWSLPWRGVGTAGGVWIVMEVSQSRLELFVGVVVLLAVLLTARTVVVPINRATLSVAGLIGGVTGTATSIGGPPFALLYQHRSPQQVRTTLAVYFVIGAAISLVGLGISGELTLQETQVAALIVPILGLGVWLGTRLRARLPLEVLRPALLTVSGLSAVALIVKALV